MPTGHDADAMLLRRIVGRDQAAVGELYDRHSRLLFGIVLRMLRSRSDAEEVLQEVFMRVWTRAETYDTGLGPPAAWLVRMARNRAIDRLRSIRARAPESDGASEATVDRHPAPAAENPEALTIGAARAGELREALTALPAAQRALIEAAFFDGCTHQELAERSGVPLGTVKTRIRSGLLAMRARLERAG